VEITKRKKVMAEIYPNWIIFKNMGKKLVNILNISCGEEKSEFKKQLIV